jgi:hypothetical protein
VEKEGQNGKRKDGDRKKKLFFFGVVIFLIKLYAAIRKHVGQIKHYHHSSVFLMWIYSKQQHKFQ